MSELFERAKRGDRTALWQLILGLRPQVRRRLRGKLGAIRTHYDLDDILSSAGRRIDDATLEGRFVFRSEQEFEALCHQSRRADRLRQNPRGVSQKTGA
jgi:hypothetical protein